MCCRAVIFCSTLLLSGVRAGLLGGSILPQASLDIFKSSSKAVGVPQIPGVSNEPKRLTSQQMCSGTAALLNGKCVPGSDVIKQTSDTLDQLNIQAKVDVPLTPLEAEGKVSLNPEAINAAANLNNKNNQLKEVSDSAVPRETSTGQVSENNIPNRIGNTENQETCLETVTEVNGKPSCRGKLIFDENFDVLDNNRWEHVVQFPGAPDYEFVVYTNDKKNSFISNGKLYVKPSLLSDDGIDVINANLELEGCTSTPGSPECKKTAIGRDILPPVKSARLRTKNAFSFRYGHIEVQAKMPAGDWLFPEIWLEPKRNIYGSNRYESGLIQIAAIRSNRNLIADDKEIGARHLTASCMLGNVNVVHSEIFSTNNLGLWSSGFHTYAVNWTPENITFSVDGKEIGRLIPPADGLKKLDPFNGLQVPWTRGSKIAPFDQEFFISIGVGAGGFRMFPDNSMSNRHAKPWKNMNIKAMLLFWKDKDSWFPSWSEDSSSLQVEHIKVWAL